jgi:N-acetylmuramoyl-L-alanine amidase
MRIVLDIQHINKPHNARDRGASFEGIREVDLTFDYLNETRKLLEKEGHVVFFGLSGTYEERHSFVNERIKPDLYIAGHVNAGRGSYSLIEVDYRASERTLEIAEKMRDSFLFELPVEESFIWKLFRKGHFELTPAFIGFKCIKGVKCSALLLEPLFIDNEEHLNVLLNDPKRIARAIVKGIEDWEEGRREGEGEG